MSGCLCMECFVWGLCMPCYIYVVLSIQCCVRYVVCSLFYECCFVFRCVLLYVCVFVLSDLLVLFFVWFVLFFDTVCSMRKMGVVFRGFKRVCI